MTWIMPFQSTFFLKKVHSFLFSAALLHTQRSKTQQHTRPWQTHSGTVITVLQKVTWRRDTCPKEADQHFFYPFSLSPPSATLSCLEGTECPCCQNPATEGEGLSLASSRCRVHRKEPRARRTLSRHTAPQPTGLSTCTFSACLNKSVQNTST